MSHTNSEENLIELYLPEVAQVLHCIDALKQQQATSTSDAKRFVHSKITQLIHYMGPSIPSSSPRPPTARCKRHFDHHLHNGMSHMEAPPVNTSGGKHWWIYPGGKLRVHVPAPPPDEMDREAVAVNRKRAVHVPAPREIPKRYVRGGALRNMKTKQWKSTLDGPACVAPAVNEFHSIFEPSFGIRRSSAAHMELRTKSKRSAPPPVKGPERGPPAQVVPSLDPQAGTRYRELAQLSLRKEIPCTTRPGGLLGRANVQSTVHNAIVPSRPLTARGPVVRAKYFTDYENNSLVRDS